MNLVIIINTIKENIENIITIKNSKFITLIYKAFTLKDIDTYLNITKEKYKNANHYCYAYKINELTKCSDDKEPSNTAGIQILNVINNNDLNFVLIIVVRYFGGIKLGKSGLIKAYKESTKLCLEKASIITLEKGKNITISFNYENLKEIDYLLKDEIILNKEFDNIITYSVNTNNDNLINSIKNNKNINIKINGDVYIEKK